MIEFVDTLPMTISGKIKRALIRRLDSAKSTIEGAKTTVIDTTKNVISKAKGDK